MGICRICLLNYRPISNSVNDTTSPLMDHLMLRLADPQHGLDGVASPGIGNGLVDVVEVIELDEAVKGKLSCPVQFNQFRNKMLRHGVTLDDAEGPPSFG